MFFHRINSTEEESIQKKFRCLRYVKIFIFLFPFDVSFRNDRIPLWMTILGKIETSVNRSDVDRIRRDWNRKCVEQRQKRLRNVDNGTGEMFLFRGANICLGGALAGDSSRATDGSILVAPFLGTRYESERKRWETVAENTFFHPVATNDKSSPFSSAHTPPMDEYI